MSSSRSQPSPQPKGFTLVEILIVAALIALFAGLAMLAMDYLVTQSKKKAATADARSISDALTDANFAYGIYPKLCYLSLTVDAIQRTGPGGQPLLIPDFDYIGFHTLTNPVLQNRAMKILRDWRGPFLPPPAGRAVTGAPRAGVCKMRMPWQDRATTAYSDLYDWPADPWGNPYVVYLVTVTSDGRPTWVTSPTQAPDYFARVVSYGPNGIPGGFPRINEKVPAGSPQEIINLAERYKLYTKEADHFAALSPADYEIPINRLAALRKDLGYMSEDARFAGYIPGIMDSGSDDITVPLH